VTSDFDRVGSSESVSKLDKDLQNIIIQIMAGKLKKGALVRAVREKLENSLEAKASDTRFPPYIFESNGEIVDLNDEYALVKFYVSTPQIWFRIDQLELV